MSLSRDSAFQPIDAGAGERAAETSRGGESRGAESKEKALWARRVRPETTLLALAAACTLVAKLIAVRDYRPTSLLVSWASVALSDVVFFAGVAALIWFAYALKPSRIVARVTAAVAALILVWSVVNAAWLVVTGVQFQVGVVLVVLRHPTEFWPTVRPHVSKLPMVSCAGAVATIAALGWIIWRVVRPVSIVPDGRRHARRACTAVGVAIVAGALQLQASSVGMGSVGQVLNFSSHWYALVTGFDDRPAPGEAEKQARYVPRAGEREVRLPDSDPAGLPNVVLVMMESVSHVASGIGDEVCTPMPTLERLRDEGVEFTSTHVPVARTGKAFWAVLVRDHAGRVSRLFRGGAGGRAVRGIAVAAGAYRLPQCVLRDVEGDVRVRAGHACELRV